MARMVILVVLCMPTLAAGAVDEPGLAGGVDEPGLFEQWTAPKPERRFNLALGMGLSSLVVDPDTEQGVGGGLYFGARAYRRLGVELTVFASHNGYAGQSGNLGAALLDGFLAANITIGPTVELTPPGYWIRVSADGGMGAYVVISAIQEEVWTFGLAMGVTVEARLTDWFGVGVKPRYHLFNLGTLAGDPLRDRVSLQEVGVVDRLEVPLFLALHF